MFQKEKTPRPSFLQFPKSCYYPLTQTRSHIHIHTEETEDICVHGPMILSYQSSYQQRRGMVSFKGVLFSGVWSHGLGSEHVGHSDWRHSTSELIDFWGVRTASGPSFVKHSNWWPHQRAVNYSVLIELQFVLEQNTENECSQNPSQRVQKWAVDIYPSGLNRIQQPPTTIILFLLVVKSSWKTMDLKYKKYIFKIMQQGNSEMNNKEDCSIDLWMACWWKGFWVERRGKGNGVELEPNAPLLRTSKLGFGSVPLTRFYPLNEKPLNNK